MMPVCNPHSDQYLSSIAELWRSFDCVPQGKRNLGAGSGVMAPYAIGAANGRLGGGDLLTFPPVTAGYDIALRFPVRSAKSP